MKVISLLMFAAALVFSACNPNARPRPAEIPELNLSAQEKLEHKTDMPQFLSGAVAFGMKNDRFPLEIIDALLAENSNWVGKCPVCDNVKRGIKSYQREAKGDAKTRLSKTDQESLSSADDAVRRPAIQTLVDRYVKQYYTALDMSDQERMAMKKNLESGRKQGMSGANGGEGFFCPSCDGACEMPKH